MFMLNNKVPLVITVFISKSKLKFTSFKHLQSSTRKMSYKYIHKQSRFSASEKDFYEKNGYILVKNNVRPELIEVCRQRFLDICNGADDYSLSVVKDPVLREKGAKGEFLLNKLQDYLYDDVLWKYASCKEVVDVVENIIGPNITGVHSMLINKPPDSDPNVSRHPIHQDLHYFPFRPADTIVASWTAMERVDENNGCLFIVPGSHSSPLYKHEYPQGLAHSMYHGVQGKDHLPKQFVVMEKGDTVFFHPLILHGSGPNRTKGFRKAISCHYADTNSNFVDVTNTTQENIAQEVLDIVYKRTGSRPSYADIWRAKSRLVRGPPGNFQKFESHL